MGKVTGADSNLKKILQNAGDGGDVTVPRGASLAENAAHTLREMILLEKLPAGTQLPERNLAEALNISRTPLREAIRILATEGLVAYTPSRRPFVADPSIEEINDSLRVQGSLEALAGEWACDLASDEEIATITSINDSIFEARKGEEKLKAFRSDMGFHEAIVAASRNETLIETHARLNARLWRVRFLSSQRQAGREATSREHQEIVDALTARDAKAAAKALKGHLRTAERNVAAAIAERQELAGETKS